MLHWMAVFVCLVHVWLISICPSLCEVTRKTSLNLDSRIKGSSLIGKLGKNFMYQTGWRSWLDPQVRWENLLTGQLLTEDRESVEDTEIM